MPVRVNEDDSVDLEANLDLTTTHALLQLIVKRDHRSVDQAVAEALLLQAYFMEKAAEGYKVVLVEPSGNQQLVPFDDMTAVPN